MIHRMDHNWKWKYMINAWACFVCQENQNPSVNLIEFKIIPIRADHKTLNATFIKWNTFNISVYMFNNECHRCHLNNNPDHEYHQQINDLNFTTILLWVKKTIKKFPWKFNVACHKTGLQFNPDWICTCMAVRCQ